MVIHFQTWLTIFTYVIIDFDNILLTGLMPVYVITSELREVRKKDTCRRLLSVNDSPQSKNFIKTSKYHHTEEF